jgi:hypothetical protein
MNLRSFFETQLQNLGKQTEQSKAQLSACLHQIEGEDRRSIEQCQNSLAASMAEIDDRLARDGRESQVRKLA